MGKSILIITLGVSLIIGFIILKLNTNATSGVETTVNKFDQMHARLIANSGAEIYLEQLFQNHSLFDIKTSPTNNLMNGTYYIEVAGTIQNIIITSHAKFLNIDHTSIVEASLIDITWPALKGALYLPTNAITWSNVGNAKININGHNHDWDGNLDTNSQSTYGIYVDNKSDSVKIIEKLEVNKNAFIYGLGDDTTKYSIGVRDSAYNNTDWKKLSDVLVSAAGPNVYNSKDKIPNPLGTKLDPIVAVINEPDITKKVTLNNFEGSGILVVNGNISIEGTFTWRGLIIAYKEATMEISLSGNPLIIGQIIATGNNIEFLGKGTINIKYSAQALNLAINEPDELGFKVLSWWE